MEELGQVCSTYEIRGHGACYVQHDPHVCNHYRGAHTTAHHQRLAVHEPRANSGIENLFIR